MIDMNVLETKLMKPQALRQLLALMLLTLICVLPFGYAVAQPLTPPRLMTLSPTGVDLAMGAYTTSVTDIAIGSLRLERSYLSSDVSGLGMSSQYFGQGWTHNFDIIARQHNFNSDERSEVIIGRSTYKFTGYPPSTHPEMDEAGTTLTSVGGAMVFTDRDGTIYQFLAGYYAKVSTITYPDGTILTFNYVSGLPKTIVSNKGYALVFDYSSSLVTAACGYNLAFTYVTTSTTCSSATLKVSYGYTSSKLTSVTDVLSNVAHYSYTTAGLLSCATDPGTTTCKVTNTYVSGGGSIIYVGSQVTADGGAWSYQCDCGIAELADPEDLNPQDGTRMTEPSGATVDMIFIHGSPSYYKNENAQVYTPSYVGRTLLSMVSPEGNKANFSYNSSLVESKRSFVAKPGSGLSNIDQGTKTFPTSCTNPIICNLPLTVTDARGNVATYTYDSTHGGVLTETSPANNAGISAVVRHAYAQKYAYVMNSGGTYSAASTPVWLLTEDRSCNSTATVSGACAGGSTDEVVTAYDYGPASGPNNLLLRGKAVTAWDPATSSYLTLRTCYTYDWMGNKISETSPRANLSNCS